MYESATIQEWTRLMACFPGSFINTHGEFIAHRKANIWFNLFACRTPMEIKCKVLEYLSRAAYKSEPFSSDRANRKLHQQMRDGINEYLVTNFTEDDMDEIYTYLGNGCNHAKTMRFIASGYNMTVLSQEGELTKDDRSNSPSEGQ